METPAAGKRDFAVGRLTSIAFEDMKLWPHWIIAGRFVWDGMVIEAPESHFPLPCDTHLLGCKEMEEAPTKLGI